MLQNQHAVPREISPADGHYFFGYYDLQPYDATERYHLCHKVPFIDRLPTAEDVAELGVIDLETREFHRLATTTAWNFQQGAMLQWYGKDRILYNVRCGDRFCTAITDCKTGETVTYPLPSANVSADGRYSLSVNFSRIYDFRPGYGYADVPDVNAAVNAPSDDGVWLQDLRTGESNLIITYERIAREFPELPFSAGKLVVNHITFNPSGDRFLFLLRNFPAPGEKWGTMLLTSDLQGNMYKLTNFEVNSHYHWKNDREILMVYGADQQSYAVYLMEDQTQNRTLIPEKTFYAADIHCLYSPDRRVFSGDGYPDEEKYRSIYLYNLEDGSCTTLARVYSQEYSCIDLRCDLHARWSPSGNKLSFDSDATGRRTICELNL